LADVLSVDGRPVLFVGKKKVGPFIRANARYYMMKALSIELAQG
jgi:hypothetical protein